MTEHTSLAKCPLRVPVAGLSEASPEINS